MTATPQELLAMTRERVQDLVSDWAAGLPLCYHGALARAGDLAKLRDAIVAILPGADTRDAVIEECAKVCADLGETYRSEIPQSRTEDHEVTNYDRWVAADLCANKIRLLKSPP